MAKSAGKKNARKAADRAVIEPDIKENTENGIDVETVESVSGADDHALDPVGDILDETAGESDETEGEPEETASEPEAMEGEPDEPEENNGADAAKDRVFLYLLTVAAAVAVIAAGFAAGRFAVPVSDESIEAAKKEILAEDSEYRSVKSKGEELLKEIEKLDEDNKRIEETFNDVIEYQMKYDELEKEYNSLKDELDEADAAKKELQKKYDGAAKELEELRAKTVTLSPGSYTVGEHIPDGVYLVKGSGSLLTAGTDKTLKVNVLLDKTTPYRCSLAAGDTIKLSTEAVFVPEEERNG